MRNGSRPPFERRFQFPKKKCRKSWRPGRRNAQKAPEIHSKLRQILKQEVERLESGTLTHATNKPQPFCVTSSEGDSGGVLCVFHFVCRFRLRDGTFVLGRVLPLFNTATAVVSLPTMILSSLVLIAKKQPTLDILRLDE